jgi:hypothetical protein
MRGILSLGWATVCNLLADLGTGASNRLDDHFAFYHHPNGWRSGWALYARLPFTGISALAERVDVDMGTGVARVAGGFTRYQGQHQLTVCLEKAERSRLAGGCR